MTVHVSTDDVVAVIGFSAFTNIIEARAGSEFRIPCEPTDQIIQWLGEGTAARFCEEFGGCKIDVPNGKRTPSVRSQVLSLLRRGFKEAEIVDIVGCTGRAVRKHKRWARETGTVPGYGGPSDMDNEPRFATGIPEPCPPPPGPGGRALPGPKGGK